MDSKRVYLCRHAQYRQTANYPTGVLTEFGFHQAKSLGSYLRDVLKVSDDSSIICSSMSRSIMTGTTVARSLGILYRNNLVSDERLIEQRAPISEEYISNLVLPALEALVQRATTTTVITILHGNINKGIFEHLGTSYQHVMGNCGLYALDFKGQQWVDKKFYRSCEVMQEKIELLAAK